MRVLLGIATLTTALLLGSTAPGVARPVHDDPTWRAADVGTVQQLRGLDAVDRDVAWVSGSAGGVWRTTDGGASWQDVSPPGADGLLFRDVEATDATHAQILSIGEADASRIYRTTDGGATWQRTFTNDDPARSTTASLLARRQARRRDERPGRREVPDHRDQGLRCLVAAVDPAGMPAAVDGEFGFAASGTCLVTAGGRDVWLASGGSASRVFHSRDRGHTWTVARHHDPRSAGRRRVLPGVPQPPAGLSRSVATSPHRTTAPTPRRTPATAGAPGRTAATWAATAPASAWLSRRAPDGGRGRPQRQRPDPRRRRAPGTGSATPAFDAVQCTKDGACWASGTDRPGGPAGALTRASQRHRRRATLGS